MSTQTIAQMWRDAQRDKEKVKLKTATVQKWCPRCGIRKAELITTEGVATTCYPCHVIVTNLKTNSAAATEHKAAPTRRCESCKRELDPLIDSPRFCMSCIKRLTRNVPNPVPTSKPTELPTNSAASIAGRKKRKFH